MFDSDSIGTKKATCFLMCISVGVGILAGNQWTGTSQTADALYPCPFGCDIKMLFQHTEEACVYELVEVLDAEGTAQF